MQVGQKETAAGMVVLGNEIEQIMSSVDRQILMVSHVRGSLLVMCPAQTPCSSTEEKLSLLGGQQAEGKMCCTDPPPLGHSESVLPAVLKYTN